MMNSNKYDLLLDQESLKRHYDTIDPDYRKLFLFYISNKYNEFKNNANLKEPKSLEEAVNSAKEPLNLEEAISSANDFFSFIEKKYQEITNKQPKDFELIIRETELDADDKKEMSPVIDEINETLKEIYEEDQLNEEQRNTAVKKVNKEKVNTVRKPMNAITESIILGVIPKANQVDDILREATMNLKDPSELHIISVTDEFEQGAPMLQPHDLENIADEKGLVIKHHQVPMTDFGAEITPQSLLATVYKMRKIIEDGGLVYIHCKAGCARSAMIVATYLAIFDKTINTKEYPLKLAVEKLMKLRPQVNLHYEKVNDWANLMRLSKIKKLQKAQEAINIHHEIKNEIKNEIKEEKIKNIAKIDDELVVDQNDLKTRDLKIEDYTRKFNDLSRHQSWGRLAWDRPIIKPKKESLLTTFKNTITKETKAWNFKRGDSLLSSYEFKNDLINFTAFKQLKIEIMQSKNPIKNINKQYLKELNKKIFEADNDSWYTEFKDHKGPLWKLYVNSKITDNLRETINAFIREIEIYKQNVIDNKIIEMKLPQLKREDQIKTKKSTSSKKSLSKHMSEAQIFSRFAHNDKDQATSLAIDIASHANDRKYAANATLKNESLTEDKEWIKLGGIYVKLMLDAKDISGLELNKIQFNFCVDGLPSNKETIQKAIEMYVNRELDNSNDITDERKQELRRLTRPFSIQLPDNSNNLHHYNKALTLRAKSFADAAQMMIDNSKFKNDELKTKQIIANLFNSFQENIGKTHIKTEQQAFYEAYIKALQNVLRNVYAKNNINLNDKDISTYLKNAETLGNINHKNAQVTISGELNTKESLLKGKVALQIEEPLTQFKYLSEEQREAWIKAITAYKNKDQENIPAWFNEMPEFEKNIWQERLKEIDNNNFEEMNAAITPVVKKQGVPGLRNLALSTFASIKYNGKLPAETFIANKSVRSSNLVVQKKEGKSELSKGELELTKMNIEQVNHVYKTNNIEQPFLDLWQVSKDRPKYLLCQTLVRKFGGGDQSIIDHKINALNKVKSSYSPAESYDLTLHNSNHCIGAPNLLVHGFMHAIGSNTQTMNHVIEPVEGFFTAAVIPTLKRSLPDMPERIIDEKIMPLLNKAKEGNLTSIDEINNAFATGYLKQFVQDKDSQVVKIRMQQLDSIKKVLLALSTYKKINVKSSSYKKHYQLHMAALEEIIYAETGNRIQSSCKSGKDREGILKTYRNAVLEFYDKYDRLPPAKQTLNADQTVNQDRQNFVEIFIQLFKTNHQARLAELNANGCQGLKALSNILPKDILDELKREYGEELRTHKENSALNILGASHVARDKTAYEHAKTIYKDIIKEMSESEGLKHSRDI